MKTKTAVSGNHCVLDANQLDLAFYRNNPGQMLKIKLEVDVNLPVH